MKEKLIIKNFGPIKEVDLDLSKVTVLIGEQATGKSTVAKVLSICRFFSYILETDAFDDIFHGPFYKGLASWGLTEYLQEETYIYYSCFHYTLTVKRTDAKVSEIYNAEIKDNGKVKLDTKLVDRPVYLPEIQSNSKEFQKLLEEYNKVKPNVKENRMYVPHSFFLTDVKNVLDNPFYLPTERGLQSVFSIGQASIPNLSSFLFNYFTKVDVALRSFTSDTFVSPVAIEYKYNNGSSYIRKKDEKEFFQLANAASGFQSVVPLVLVIKYQNETRKKKKTFIIEEPELNLFPSAQNKLIQYLIEQSNDFDNVFLLTTHSPYILTSLNNLMYAYQVGQMHPEKVTEKIEKKYWLNPEDVSAYMLYSNGKCEKIIDDEGLIKAEKIDEVSKIINSEFNHIMNIELDIDEENS